MVIILNNNVSLYFKQKNDELSLFNSSIAYSQESSLVDNIQNLLLAKLKAQSIIKSKFIKKNFNYRNTGKNIQKLDFDDFSCSYEYQRYDMSIKCKNFLNKFYDIDNENCENYIFTNCGMSAISGVFYALHKLKYNIEFVGNIYVETERVLEQYIVNNRNWTKKTLFLDTVSFEPLLELIDKIKCEEYDIFIFDTTLYLNDEVKKVISKLRKYHKPIILVKSHTKLDMIGIEWSRLGSICIIGDNNEMSQKLYKEIRIVLSFIGGFAYLEDIPLFFSDDNFKNIVLARAQNIKDNTMYIHNRLNKENLNCRFVVPNHKLFILIFPNKFIDYKQLEKDLRAFAEKSKYKDLLCYADSFGLDYFGVNGYYPSMAADTEVIRISPSDFPKEIVDELIIELVSWLKPYLND